MICSQFQTINCPCPNGTNISVTCGYASNIPNSCIILLSIGTCTSVEYDPSICGSRLTQVIQDCLSSACVNAQSQCTKGQ